MNTSNDAVAELKPEALWRNFSDIARIPHGSGNEAALAKHVVNTATRLGLWAKQDRVGNVLVKKPASPGRNNVRSVCLQGHLDMVCEKNHDKVFDFRTDSIELVRNGNVLSANGTTLGADNGIAVATELAIMQDSTLKHGPLELLFTVEEETALTGASNLEAGFIESRVLINLDSEEEGSLYVGCSGGKDTWGTFDIDTEAAPADNVVALLSVKGLKGGHSGLDIEKNRGNAVKLLTRVCRALADTGFRMASIQGGNKRNAIPREAEALVVFPRSRYAEAEARVTSLEAVLRAELAGVDDGLCVSLARQRDQELMVFAESDQEVLLQALDALPHGVVEMSQEMPDLVETSTNLAAVEMPRVPDGTVILVATSQRSSVPSKLIGIGDAVRSCLESAGASVTQDSGYPGWTPNLKSEILAATREAYRELYGKAPLIKAIHAGLECGIIAERYPGMDMVSFGPTLQGVHSPDERIYIDTVGRFWDLLVTTLAQMR